MSQLTLYTELSTKLELQCQIAEHIAETSQCYTYFDFCENQETTTEKEMTEGNMFMPMPMFVVISTYNPYHRRAFVMGEFRGQTHLEALNSALTYVQSETDTSLDRYQVTWTDLEAEQSYVSHFRGQTENLVKTKFYCSTDYFSNLRIDQINKI